MKWFHVGAWEHTAPENEYDVNGRRGIVRHLCFGPLETIIYGVTNDSKCYFEHHIIEGIQEGDLFFEYIAPSKLLNAICKEIALCRKYSAEEMIPLFQAEKEKLEKTADLSERSI